MGLEPLVALARSDDLSPRADRLFDRRQRPAHDDRRGNHRAAGDLVLKGEVCAGAEARDLDRDPQELGEGQQHAGDIGGALLVGSDRRDLVLPAPQDCRDHAHAVDDLGVARDRLGLTMQSHGITIGALEITVCQPAVGHGRQEQQEGAAHRQPADQRMEQEGDREVDRHPGKIVERHHRRAAQEGAAHAEVAQAFHAITRTPQPRLKAARESLGPDDTLDPAAGAAKHQCARPFQHGLEHERDNHDQRQVDQCVGAARGQDAVEQLQHV